MGSIPWKLNLADLTSIGKGALIMIAGSLLTAIASIALPALDVTADSKTLIYAVVLSVVVNAARKLATDTR